MSARVWAAGSPGEEIMRKPANVSQRLLVTALALVAAAPLAGCGDKRERRSNLDRPALPIVVGAIVTKDTIRVSPDSIGAGEIDLVVTNRSTKARSITLESIDGGGTSAVALETTPISAGENSRAQANLEPGTYELRAGDDIEPAVIRVGPDRPSSQDELLTP